MFVTGGTWVKQQTKWSAIFAFIAVFERSRQKHTHTHTQREREREREKS